MASCILALYGSNHRFMNTYIKSKILLVLKIKVFWANKRIIKKIVSRIHVAVLERIQNSLEKCIRLIKIKITRNNKNMRVMYVTVFILMR